MIYLYNINIFTIWGKKGPATLFPQFVKSGELLHWTF